MASRFLPSPVAMLSGALLFALLLAFGAAASLVVPALSELLESSPRLAMLGFLAFATSPGIVVAIAHHAFGRTLDQLDRATAGSRARSVLPGVESWAAGAHGWLVLYGTSVLTTLVLLVIEPPKLEPDTFTLTSVVSHLSVAHVASVQSGLWILIATLLFELQRRARRA